MQLISFALHGQMHLKLDSGSQIVADYPKHKDESNKDQQIHAIFIRLFWIYLLVIVLIY
jgi:hypothetical protein